MPSKGYSKLSADELGGEEEEEINIEKDAFLQPQKDTLSKEEEASPSPKKKFSRRQKIFLASLFILVAGVAVTLTIVLRQKSDWFEGGSRVMRADRKFTIEEVMGGKYSYSSYSLTWVADDAYIHPGGGLTKYNMTNSEIETLVTDREWYDNGFGEFSLSPDSNWLLLSNNSKRLYRHSTYADYYVKDLRPNNERSDKSQPRIIRIKKPDDDPNEQIRYCGWAKKENALVFVYKCNIYYVPTVTEIPERYFQLTDNGVQKKVFNGVPDWVYEEEILASTHAIEFSKDGRYLSFVTFNATDVPFYKFPIYGSTANQYTTINKIAYPKAGYPNPTIKFSVLDIDQVLKTRKDQKFESKRSHPKPPAEFAKGEYYYAVMRWTTGNELFVQWMNRAQNETICITYKPDADTGKTVEEHKTPNGWIDDDYVKPKFSNDGSYYITMLPKDDNRHLAKVSLNSSQASPSINYLTEGDYWVQDINCYDSQNEVIYFRSTEESTRHRQVYSINVKTKEKKCLSCGLIRDPDNPKQACTYHYPVFSKQCSFVSMMCQGPFVPLVQMVNVKENRLYNMLAENSDARKKLKERDVPLNVYYTVEADGVKIPVKETRPPNFSEDKKYAVLFDVYGGPNTQKVTDQYEIGFDHYFVVSHEIILVTFDARGTGFNGYSFLHAVYKKLGHYEAVDAINVAKYLGKQKYIDASRIAIWGWSYGGFYAATALAEANDIIQTAVSVAPVTDWRYYDTVYSERYMGFPSIEDNLRGYQETNVMSKAEKFKGKNFLLIHGTADDNVHFQNSAQLTSALIRNQIKFRTQYYPDKDHGINPRDHLYGTLSEFLITKMSLRPT